MIKPMLCKTLEKANIIHWNEWVIEEKFDGHRLIVEVSARGVDAWTRPRKHAGTPDEKTMLKQELPDHLVTDLRCLPYGIYDGEKIVDAPDGAATSSDVTRLDLSNTVGFVVFDVLRTDDGLPCLSQPYAARRAYLEVLAGQRPDPRWTARTKPRGKSCFVGRVRLASSHPVTSMQDVTRFVERVWLRGGEGAILKRLAAPYQPGKRSPDFIKVKKRTTAVLTLVGFEPSRGEKMNRGPFAICVLENKRDRKGQLDDPNVPEGTQTTVKTPDDAQLAAFEAKRHRSNYRHPDLGRKVRIEFQDYTRECTYRGPVVWDRWEDE